MITILVANAKGGAGKTTLSTNLAGALAGRGHSVMIADADRQGSSRQWIDRRPSTVPPIRVEDWSKRVGNPPQGIDRLVIDGPAGIRKDDVDALVGLADIIVMPVLPSIFDQLASQRFLERLEDLKPIRKNRKTVAVVGNRVRSGTKAAQRLDTFLGGLGHTVLTRLRDTQLYGEAAASGLSIFDMPQRRSATAREDWVPLIAYIEEGVL